MKVDRRVAIMSQAEFEELPEYNCSVPTGKWEGKRWKRDLLWALKGHENEWVMIELQASGHDMLKYVTRDIRVLSKDRKTAGPQWTERDNDAAFKAFQDGKVNTACCGTAGPECLLRKNRAIVMRPG